MAITIVQRAHGVIGPLSLNGENGTVSFAVPTTAGNAIMAFVWWTYSLRPSIIAFPSDEIDNTWNNDPDFVTYDHFPPGWPSGPSINGYLFKALKNTGLHATDGTPPASMQHFSMTLNQDADTPVTYNVWLFEISGLTENINPGFGYSAGPFGYVPARVPVDQTVHGDPPASTSLTVSPARPSISVGKDAIALAGVITDGGAVTSVDMPWTLEPIQNGVGVAVAFGISDTIPAPVFHSSSAPYALLWNTAGNPVPPPPPPVVPTCGIWMSDLDTGVVRYIDPAGVISTPALTSSDSFFIANGGLIRAWGICTDAAGNLYVVDEANGSPGDGIVYKITPGLVVTRIAGPSGGGAGALGFSFNDIYGVGVDSAGNVYISDNSNRFVYAVNTQATTQTLLGVNIAAGAIAAIAGNGTGGAPLNNVPATTSPIGQVYSLAFDAADNLFICDQTNDIIRRIDHATGVITTIAGTQGVAGYAGDGGDPLSAEVDQPLSVALDAAGNVYITDTTPNGVIRAVNRQLTPQTLLNVLIGADTIQTVVGIPTSPGYSGDGGPATSARIGDSNRSWVSQLDAAGNLFLADTFNYRIRVVDHTTGIIGTIAGIGIQGETGDNGPAVAAKIGRIVGLALVPCIVTGTITVQKTVIAGPGAFTVIRPPAVGANVAGGTWNNPGNIVTPDGNVASIALNGVNPGVVSSPGYLEGTQCNIPVPPGGIIDGIALDIKGSATSATVDSIIRPTVGVGDFVNMPLAYDGDLSTLSAGLANSTFNSRTAEWSGFAGTPPNPVSLSLNIKSAAFIVSGSSGHVDISYSLDNGLTYTILYSIATGRAVNIDVINLPLNTDLTKLKVLAGVTWNSGTSMIVEEVFEVWVAATSLAIPNPSVLAVRLLKAGSPVGATKIASLPASNGFAATLGGPTDLWGTSWLLAEISAPSFGAALVASVTDFAAVVQFSVDFLQFTIYGHTPTGQSFTFRPSWKAPFVLAGGGSDVSTVPAGTYDITEDPVPLWNTNITVSNGDPPSAIVVAPGDDIVVGVINTLLAAGPPGGTSFTPKPPVGHGPFQVVPTDNSPNQVWQVSVNVNNKSIPLSVVLRYNEIAKYWVATISDSQGNILLDSIPLITGTNFTQNLLRQFAYLGLGSAAIFNASAKSA